MRQIKANFTKKDILIVGLALIAVAAVIAAAIWPVTTRSKDKTDGAGQNASNSSAQSAEKLTDSIELPGYGELSFKAGTERQEVCLSNPEKNFCYIDKRFYLFTKQSLKNLRGCRYFLVLTTYPLSSMMLLYLPIERL